MAHADRSHRITLRRCIASSALACTMVVNAGCLGLTPQLRPADVAELEHLEDRESREAAYERERIRAEFDPRGKRFYKGTDPNAPRRNWQSLDATLRSDRNSAAALPYKKLRTSRILAGISLVGGLVMVAGAAATAREALNLGRVTGPSLVLLGGASVSLGFGIGAGVTFGQARKGYEDAVDVYNDSLGLRLGLYDENGVYLPPPGTVLDEDGFMILKDDVVAASRATSTDADSGIGAHGEASPPPTQDLANQDGAEPASAPATSPALRLGHRDLTPAAAR